MATVYQTLLTGGAGYDIKPLSSASSTSTAGDFFSSTGGALSLTGAIASAIGAFQSAGMTKSTLKHQARMAEINARVTDLGRRSALMQGTRRAQQIRMEGANRKASVTASYAARGVDLGSESVQNVLNTNDFFTESDAITAENNALMAAFGYQVQESTLLSQADMARADAGAVSPFGSAAASLIGSAGSIADRWYTYTKLRG